MNWLKQRLNQFQQIKHGLGQVLSINQRNLHYIYQYNARKHYPIADNKLTTKVWLANRNIPIPKTYATFHSFHELKALPEQLALHQEFVIKPASGSGGGGILVIAGKAANGDWQTVGGSSYSLSDLRKHIADIIFGVHSFDLHDAAFIEERIAQHPEVNRLSPYGLADVRLIFCQDQPAMAMIRLATRHSHGTANLHQGAVGVGVDIESGVTTHASIRGETVTNHPDSNTPLLGYPLPFWSEVVGVGRRIAELVPLKYIGIDIALSHDGPRLLEINARPGIEIQNVNGRGMRRQLENIVRNTGS